MKSHLGLQIGGILLLTVILLVAGCTQPAPVPEKTPTSMETPTAPTATPALNGTDVKDLMAARAVAYSGEINRKALATALAEGPNSTAFTAVLDQLREFKSRDPRIVYLYTLEQRNGKVYFIVDADYGMPNGSGYMDEYTDAPKELFSPVTKPIAVGPYTDQWGTFYSGYAPVDLGVNRTILIGVDIRA